MSNKRALFVTLLFSLLSSACSNYTPYVVPETSIGLVVDSIGFPSVVRNSRPYILAEASQIYPADVISTDDQSLLQFSLNSRAVITLGPRSQLLVAEFLREEEAVTGELMLRSGSVELGGFRATDSFSVNTTMASVRSDSPSFWIAYTDEGSQLEVVSLSTNKVTVSNQSGTVILDSVFKRTTIKAGSAPQNAIQWSSKKFNETRDAHLRITRESR